MASTLGSFREIYTIQQGLLEKRETAMCPFFASRKLRTNDLTVGKL